MVVLKKIFFIVLLFFIVTPFIYAGSLGMSPSSFRFNFKPGLEEMVTIRVSSSDMAQPISIYVTGDLSQYVNVSAKNFIGAGILDIKIKLPQKIDKPGNHRIIIGSREDKNNSGGMIGGASAIQVPIDIFVPYPGKYAEAEFAISNANENEPVFYRLVVNNLGTQSINFSYDIDIFSDSANSSLYHLRNSSFLEANQRMTLEDTTKDVKFTPGNYIGFAKISYDSEIDLNSSFKIGTFLVNITDYDYEFTAGKISPFNLHAVSSWNSDINKTYIEVSVTDSGVVKSYFKSPLYSFAPMEEKKLEGYIDATNITPGRYIGNIILNYDGKETSKLVAFYFIKPEMTKTEKLLYLAAGIIVLFIIIIIALFVKLYLAKRRRKSGK